MPGSGENIGTAKDPPPEAQRGGTWPTGTAREGHLDPQEETRARGPEMTPHLWVWTVRGALKHVNWEKAPAGSEQGLASRGNPGFGSACPPARFSAASVSGFQPRTAPKPPTPTQWGRGGFKQREERSRSASEPIAGAPRARGGRMPKLRCAETLPRAAAALPKMELPPLERRGGRGMMLSSPDGRTRRQS